MIHRLKVEARFFPALVDGSKTFEVRRDDRGYGKRDTLVLREWVPDGGYTGRSVEREVTYVLRGRDAEDYGLLPGFAVLGLAEVTP